MKEMTDFQKSECKSIITAAADKCAGFVLSGYPGSELDPMKEAQIQMVISLGDLFNVKLDENLANECIKKHFESYIRIIMDYELLDIINFVGTDVNAAVAYRITDTMGWVVAEDFAKKEPEYLH